MSEDLQWAQGLSSLGHVLVARSDQGLCAVLLGDQPQALHQDLHSRFQGAHWHAGGATLQAWLTPVLALIEAPHTGLDLPLDARGSAFQCRVWQALQTIPPGQTRSYTALAAQIGSPRSVRAVAGACAANPLAVVLPCHRVVRLDGGLSGYRWGLARKQALLRREAAAANAAAARPGTA